MEHGKLAQTLPGGSFDIEEVSELTEGDLQYIAEWLAKAFGGSDAFAYLVTGKSYREEPDLHVFFVKALLQRQLVDGIAVTNGPRTAFRVIFRPGQKDRGMELDWQSPKDDNWNLLLERCGGKDVVRARTRATFEAVASQFRQLYGEDEGLSLYRSGNFAVHPEYQLMGIGRALHQYMADVAKAERKKWFFLSMERNVPAYLKFGCTLVGDKIPTTIPPEVLAQYPLGNEYLRVLEA